MKKVIGILLIAIVFLVVFGYMIVDIGWVALFEILWIIGVLVCLVWIGVLLINDEL